MTTKQHDKDSFWDSIPNNRWSMIKKRFTGADAGANWQPNPSTTQWVDVLADE